MSRSNARRHVSREETKKAQPSCNQRVSRTRFFWIEWLGWACLVALTVFFLATSWRKWPDALIDFGHDLYIPWRIANGAVLYRDIDDIYGPLSDYANAVLFRVFGTSMMVLIYANILVFALILAVIYVLFRLAWGKFAAFFSSAIFIAVFAFSQYVGNGNYNYAAPYSHEATHGMLVSLLLVLTLVRWVENPAPLPGFLAGLLIGLTAVLKSEFILAGGLLALAALLMRWRFKRTVPVAAIPSFAAGVVLPTTAFAAFFSAYLPWNDALFNASRAWLNTIRTTRFTADPVQVGFLGLDRPWQHLTEHAAATLFAVLIIAAICAGAWFAERTARSSPRLLLTGAMIAAVAWLAISKINWTFSGRCLLALTIASVLFSAWSTIRAAPSESDLPISAARLLIAVLAAALMARMFLNGRIIQYGFYQAALAAILVPAVVISELPDRLHLRQWGKNTVMAGALALFIPGIATFVGRSQHLLGLKTLAVGQGGDQYYCFPQEREATGELVRLVTQQLARFSGAQTLVVLPEGEMINYLLRMPNPVAPFIFYSAATAEGRGAKVVHDLEHKPPDWVVIISRDLREYGIHRYGEAPGKGQEIIRWVTDHYEQAASIGGDPLDLRTRGALILHRTKPR